jgi:disulfide bond formation protein DsbB
MMDRIEAAGTIAPARRLFSILATLMMMVGLLIGGFVGTASATTTTYGFWNLDGCHYTWAGPVDGWRKGTCESADHVQWGRGDAASQLYHWDGNHWRFQGIYDRGTMDTPNGIFIVPFITRQEEHLFIYDYADKAWFHIRTILQSVQSVPVTPELETTSGWRSLVDLNDPALGSMVNQWETLRDVIIEIPR